MLLGLMWVIYFSKFLPEPNIFTPVHIWMADVGMIHHTEVIALQQIGESPESRKRNLETGFMSYNEAASQDRKLPKHEFGPVSPAVLSQHKLHQQTVKAPSVSRKPKTDEDI
eukprot:TRINITY_DN3430_c0_g1_i2.p1 TRINITY_DN3430_c0_g1~~TRINITY_DN3430_c0_g1_i2.p1  ORF type:complete len:112 (+),score=7.06 TRINITY_DN3430_c0_g1_i2:313-648(+)